MEKEYLAKTITCLTELIACLDDPHRSQFYEINANINSLMIEPNGLLKPDFTIVLPNDTAGFFANMMWNISRTGAYFGDPINGYTIDSIKQCTNKVIDCLKECEDKIESENNVDFYHQLFYACSMLLANIVYINRKDQTGHQINVKEDYRNYYIRDLFDFKGMYVRGQEHQGTSPNEKGSGEVDILVCHTPSQEKIYIEGMNLKCVDKSYIEAHYEKLFSYDRAKYKTNYLLSYVSDTNFETFRKDYKNFFMNYSGSTKCYSIEEVPSDCAEIVVFKSESIHNDNTVFTYHFLLHFLDRT